MKKAFKILLPLIILSAITVFAMATDTVCTTYTAEEITYYSAKLNGYMAPGSATVSEYGFTVYNDNGKSETVVVGKNASAAVSISREVLVLSDTKYYYKTYAKLNNGQILYGNEISFTTESRPKTEMPVVNFNVRVTDPDELDVIKTPNMFFLNNMIINQKDKLQLIAGTNFNGQGNIHYAGDNPVLLNRFFMENYHENEWLKGTLTFFDALYNLDDFVIDAGTTVISIFGNDELDEILYDVGGNMEYKRYAGALTEAIKSDYVSSDKRTFSYDEANFAQFTAIADVIDVGQIIMKDSKVVVDSIKASGYLKDDVEEIAGEYINKIMQRYITAGTRAVEANRALCANGDSMSNFEKKERIAQLSRDLKDYRTYAGWNFSDEQLADWKASFDTEYCAPKSKTLFTQADFVLSAVGETLNSIALTEQLVENKELFKDLFLRLKDQTKSKKMKTILENYAETTENSFASGSIDVLKGIGAAYTGTVIKSAIGDIATETAKLKIANVAAASGKAVAQTTATKLATLNYALLAKDVGLFFASAIFNTRNLLEKSIELRYLYNVEIDSLSMLQNDLDAYVQNPSEERAEIVLKDLIWLKALRLRGITIANELYQSNSSSLFQQAGTALGAIEKSDVSAVYTSQKDALIRATLYANGYTTEHLTLNSKDQYVIYQPDSTGDTYNGTLNGVAFSYACGRLAGGVTLNGSMVISNSNPETPMEVYIPYMNIGSGGKLSVGAGVNLTIGELTDVSGATINISGKLTVESDLNQNGTIVLVGGRVNIEGNYGTSGNLQMTHEDDYICVGGNYYTGKGATAENITAGIMEIKGNITAYSTLPKPTGTHKTILSGDKAQSVSIQYGANFNILEIANTSAEGVTFSNPAGSGYSYYNVYVHKEVYSSGGVINNAEKIHLTGNAKPGNNVWDYDITLCNWTGEESITFNKNVYAYKTVTFNAENIFKGDFEIFYLYDIQQRSTNVAVNAKQTVMGMMIMGDDSTVTLNADMYVGGNLSQSGVLALNNARLDIGGNYGRSYDDLQMTHEDDYIFVNGNYYTGDGATAENITAGIMEIKGNITAYRTLTKPTGTHKTILSGDKAQSVSIQYGANFNILEITNTSAEGVTFNDSTGYSYYNVYVYKEVYSNGSVINNAKKIHLVGNAKPRNNVWDYDITLYNWTGSESITFNKNVYMRGTVTLNAENVIKGNAELVFDTNGYKLTVNAKQNILGNVLTSNRSTLTLNADMHIGGEFEQRGICTLNSVRLDIGGEYYRSGELQMTHEDDYICVGGNYGESGDGTPETLTAGTIEIKGNLTNYAYYNKPTGTHKTILSGDKAQSVSVENGASFNVLEITNTSAEGVTFERNDTYYWYNAYVYKEVYSNGSVINNANKILLTGNAKPRNNVWDYDITLYNWTGNESITFNKNVYMRGTVTLNAENVIKGNAELVFDTNGYKLTVNAKQNILGNVLTNYYSTLTLNADMYIGGEFEQRGICTLNSVRLDIVGEYYRRDGKLQMTHEDDYICVGGNYGENDSDTPETLTAGTIEIKGNLTNYAYYNKPTGTHKTILSGDKAQSVSVQYGANFNILEIANTSAEGVTFKSQVYVSGEIRQPAGTKLVNPEKVTLQGKTAFVDHGIVANMEINRCVGNHESVIPTWLDYEQYSTLDQSEPLGVRVGIIRNILNEDESDDNRYSVYLISGIDDLKYKTVGFEITVKGQTLKSKGSMVYRRIIDRKTVHLPSSFGSKCRYIFAQKIFFDKSFKDEALTFRPYAIDRAGNIIYGKEVTIDRIYTDSV